MSGTVTCPADAESAFVNVGLTQRVGRLLISGSGSTDVACTGEAESWTVLVVGDNGIFKGGKAASVTSAFACSALACGEYVDEQTVQAQGPDPLRPATRPAGVTPAPAARSRLPVARRAGGRLCATARLASSRRRDRGGPRRRAWWA